MKHNNGFTLIEILVSIAIIGILATIATTGFTKLVEKYKVSYQARTMYADIMTARTMAVKKNRVYFINLSTDQYSVYEDTHTPPDGNGTLETASDSLISQKRLDKAITWNDTATIKFTPRGLCSTLKTVCIYSSSTPEYDCIKISRTRVALGKLLAQGTCSGDNCKAK